MRISDWSSDVCSSDLFGQLHQLLREHQRAALFGDRLASIGEQSMYRQGPAFRILTKIAEAFGQFLCDPQLLRREGNFDPAVWYDFVRDIILIELHKLGSVLDEGEHTQHTDSHIGNRNGK